MPKLQNSLSLHDEEALSIHTVFVMNAEQKRYWTHQFPELTLVTRECPEGTSEVHMKLRHNAVSPPNDTLNIDRFENANEQRNEILDSEEAAAILKIHPKTLQRMARSGQLPGFQIGKLWRFHRSRLHEWLDEKAVG